MISTRSGKRGIIEIYPKFIIKKSSDLMIRGGDFYAIWIDERGMWSTDEQDAVDLIDRELDRYAEENRTRFDGNIRVLHMWDAETGMIDTWHKYCQKQMKDQFHMLDEKLIFSNTKVTKRDYASKSLPYPLEPGETPAWERLVSIIFSRGAAQDRVVHRGYRYRGSPRSCKSFWSSMERGHRKEHHHQCDHAALRGIPHQLQRQGPGLLQQRLCSGGLPRQSAGGHSA